MRDTSNRQQQHDTFTATLVCPTLEPVVSAYEHLFKLQSAPIQRLSDPLTKAWQKPELTGKRYTVLLNQTGTAWLRVIEDPGCSSTIPVNYFGWMALLLGINDLSSILPELSKYDFHLIGEPLFQDLDQQLTIHQCIGPAGEVLYLADNQHLCDVFNCDTFRHNSLLMPVLAATERQRSADYYTTLSSTKPHFRDSKLTVVSRALNKSISCLYPVASIPFNNGSIMEIDEIKALKPFPETAQPLPSGLAMLSFHVHDLSCTASLSVQPDYCIEDSFYRGQRAVLLKGPDGEWTECIEYHL